MYIVEAYSRPGLEQQGWQVVDEFTGRTVIQFFKKEHAEKACREMNNNPIELSASYETGVTMKPVDGESFNIIRVKDGAVVQPVKGFDRAWAILRRMNDRRDIGKPRDIREWRAVMNYCTTSIQENIEELRNLLDSNMAVIEYGPEGRLELMTELATAQLILEVNFSKLDKTDNLNIAQEPRNESR